MYLYVVLIEIIWFLYQEKNKHAFLLHRKKKQKSSPRPGFEPATSSSTYLELSKLSASSGVIRGSEVGVTSGLWLILMRSGTLLQGSEVLI